MAGARFDRVVLNRADLRRPFPAGFARRLRRQRVQALTRRGKYLLAVLSSGDTLVMHLGMSGWLRAEPTARRRRRRDPRRGPREPPRPRRLPDVVRHDGDLQRSPSFRRHGSRAGRWARPARVPWPDGPGTALPRLRCNRPGQSAAPIDASASRPRSSTSGLSPASATSTRARRSIWRDCRRSARPRPLPRQPARRARARNASPPPSRQSSGGPSGWAIRTGIAPRGSACTTGKAIRARRQAAGASSRGSGTRDDPRFTVGSASADVQLPVPRIRPVPQMADMDKHVTAVGVLNPGPRSERPSRRPVRPDLHGRRRPGDRRLATDGAGSADGDWHHALHADPRDSRDRRRIAILSGATWARSFGLFAAALNLISFPIGTPIGAYGLWALSRTPRSGVVV